MSPEEIAKQVKFRNVNWQRDEAFIFSSWLRSYFFSADFTRQMSKSTFYQYHHKIVEKIVKRSKIIVASPADDEDIILGYIVSETIDGLSTILHYLYVKESFRNEGLAQALFLQCFTGGHKMSCTHMTSTKPMRHLKDKYQWNYVPYLM